MAQPQVLNLDLGQLITKQMLDRSDSFQKPPDVKRTYEVSPAAKRYIEYRRKLQDRLIHLNNNMSSIVRESFESIDNICHKVRLYLTNMDNVQEHHEPEMDDKEVECTPPESEEMEQTEQIEQPEEPIEESSGTVTDSDSVHLQKLQWLNKQKRFMGVFKDSVRNIESFMKEMDCYVNKIHSKIEGLSASNVWEKRSDSEVKTVSKSNELEKKYLGPKKAKSFYSKNSSLNNSSNWDDSEMETTTIVRKMSKIQSRSGTSIWEPKPELEVIMASTKNYQKETQLAFQKSFDYVQKIQRVSEDLLSKIDHLAVENDVNFDEVESVKEVQPQVPRRYNLVVPDVTRTKGIVNLHQKLVRQVEAQDSYLCFQRLMDWTEKRLRKQRQMEEKQQQQRRKNQALKRPDNCSKLYENSLWFTKTAFKPKPRKSKEKSPKLILTKRKNKENESTETGVLHKKVEWMHAKTASRPMMIRCMDCLDTLRPSDVEPLKPEYPRKDHVQKQNSTTYLHHLLNDNHCEPMMRKLLSTTALTDSDDATRRKLTKYIFPSDGTFRRDVVVMPLTVHYYNPPKRKVQSPMERKTRQFIETLDDKHQLWLEAMEKMARSSSVKGSSRLEMRPRSCVQNQSKITKDEVKKRKDGTIVKVSKLESGKERERMRAEKEKQQATQLLQRKKIMEQIKGYKSRNDKIKTNIQKAVGVIESRMVDVLSKEKPSVKQFDTMEKEINNVLKMMKSTTTTDQSEDLESSRHRYTTDTASELNNLSDELYKKLQTIIEPSEQRRRPREPRRTPKRRTPRPKPPRSESETSIGSTSGRLAQQASKIKEISASIKNANDHIEKICQKEFATNEQTFDEEKQWEDESTAEDKEHLLDNLVYNDETTDIEDLKDLEKEIDIIINERTGILVEAPLEVETHLDEHRNSLIPELMPENCREIWGETPSERNEFIESVQQIFKKMEMVYKQLDDTDKLCESLPINEIEIKKMEDEEVNKSLLEVVDFVQNLDVGDEPNIDMFTAENLNLLDTMSEEIVDNLEEQLMHTPGEIGDYSMLPMVELKELQEEEKEKYFRQGQDLEMHIIQKELVERQTQALAVYTTKEVYFAQVYYNPRVLNYAWLQFDLKLQEEVFPKLLRTIGIDGFEPEKVNLINQMNLLKTTGEHLMSMIQNQPAITYNEAPVSTEENNEVIADNVDLIAETVELVTERLEKIDQPRRVEVQMTEVVKYPKENDDFHSKVLQTFYTVFYMFIFAAVTLQYNCL